MTFSVVMADVWRQGAVVSLALIFGLAGLGKLRRDAHFPLAVMAFTGLAAQRAEVVARWLPRLEVLLGLAVLVPVSARWAAGMLLLLTLGFLVGAIRAQRAAPTECGCFGALLPERPGNVLWGRNLFLLCLCASVLLIPQPPALPDQWLPGLILPSLLLLSLLHAEVLAALRAV